MFCKNKNPILISIGFLFLIVSLQAQQLNSSQVLLAEGAYARARESIDSFVTANPGNAAGWLQKARIYAAIAHDATAQSLVANPKLEAFSALQKAGQLNMGEVEQQLNPDRYSLAYGLYEGFTNDGLAIFNAAVERQDPQLYKEALSNFKLAGMAGQYVYRNGWGLDETDTFNVYYTALSAIKADKEEDAEIYCKKIIDKNIVNNQFRSQLESIYQWLVYLYKNRQDWDNFNYYANAGMVAFPASTYFTVSYIDWYRQQKDYRKLLGYYQVLFKKDSSSNRLQWAYYQDVFNYLYQSNSPDKGRYEAELIRGLRSFITKSPNKNEARLLLGKCYINLAANLVAQSKEQAMINRGLVKASRAKASQQLKTANIYLLQIVHQFVQDGKANYQEALQLLIKNFKFLQQPKEVRKYQQLLNRSLTALYKTLIFILLLLNIILIIGVFHL